MKAPHFELKLGDSGSFLDVTITADELSSAQALQILGEVMTAAANSHHRRICVECTMDFAQVREPLRAAIERLTEMNFPGKIAFVNCNAPGEAPEIIMPSVGLFRERSDAEAWLGRSPEGRSG